jgi:phage tail sheath protein FI
MPDPVAPGVYVDELPALNRAIVPLPTSITAFVGRAARGPCDADADAPVAVSSLEAYEHVFGASGRAFPMGFAVRDYFANGGLRALVLRLRGSDSGDDGVGTLTDADYAGDGARGTGLHALRRASLFNLLCIPPDRMDGETSPEVWRAALAICAAARAILLVDPPVAWRDARAAIASGTTALGLDGPHAGNAALYFPRLWIRDPASGAVDACVPGGAVAGLLARNDAARGVWKAAAGIEAALHGVEAPVVTVGDRDGDRLQPLSINCLRAFPRVGLVAWGARTLAAHDPDRRYIPVRRLLMHVESSIEQGTAWATMAPPGEATWARLRQAAGDFLRRLHAAGAFPAAAPRDAWFVRCGRDTMTDADIADGRLVIQVGIAPLRPAEFVTVRVVHRAPEAMPSP